MDSSRTWRIDKGPICTLCTHSRRKQGRSKNIESRRCNASELRSTHQTNFDSQKNHQWINEHEQEKRLINKCEAGKENETHSETSYENCVEEGGQVLDSTKPHFPLSQYRHRNEGQSHRNLCQCPLPVRHCHCRQLNQCSIPQPFTATTPQLRDKVDDYHSRDPGKLEKASLMKCSKGSHVILTVKKFNMVAALLTVIFYPYLVLSTVKAEGEVKALNGTPLISRAPGITGEPVTGAHRFDMTGWMNGRFVTTKNIRRIGGTSAEVQADSSHLSALNGIDIRNGLGNNNNNDSDGDGQVGEQRDSSGVTNTSFDERRKERRKTLEKTTPTKKADVMLGVPFVRAHSTGFISLVDGYDDGSTKESSFSSTVEALVGGNFLMLTPQLVGVVGGEESSTKLLRVGPCLCWNTTDGGLKREIECKCTGQEMTNVTGSLPLDIHRLTVEHAANFTTLGNEDLKKYGNSLRELVLSELSNFKTIRNGTFLGLRSLNTIYVHGAPALTHISDGVLNVYLPELKIIRITHSSLEVVPNLSQLHIKPDAALHMVELDNNQISRLIPGSFKGLVTEHLALSYNNLEELGPSAFEGSTIARLTLKGNPLKTLHSNSFVGIDSLRVLDLSETQIRYLPTHGLNGLESLRLEKVWTLSVIPSIYHFPVLEEAWLTWPYHCCAFEFPETHDPAAFQKYQEYVRSVVNELCAKASANSTSNSSNASGKKADDNGNARDSLNELNASMNNKRQKRHVRLLQAPNRFNGRYWSGGKIQSNFPSESSFSKSMMMTRRNEKEIPFWDSGNERFPKQKENGMGHDPYERVLAQRLIINEPYLTTATSFNPDLAQTSYPLWKRTEAGRHPRQASRVRRSSSRKTDHKVDEAKGRNEHPASDLYHRSQTHHNNGKGGGDDKFDTNKPPRHPFDSGDDDTTLHFGKVKPADSYDPFVMDPDQSFAPILDPQDLERESDILGKDTWGKFGHDTEAEFDEDVMGVFHPSVTPSPTVITLCGNVAVKRPPKIACHPLPDAFNPCEDIMGSIWLRGAVWVVVALALFGNTAVLVVLLLAPGRISVQRFLMANLSWADLCMGIYLLMVATQDLVSLGSYFNYAIDWQLGWGCQIAGFLTVFASELSVFTLAVITGERWYALTRAIHLTKRLTLLGAAQLMAFGWFMAILLAALPLMGVSSYSKTSICLPMEAHSGGAVAYLVFLLLFNGVAFLLVACAYWQMYRAVAGHGRPGSGAAPAASSADTAIAKKMALLVFTDFACWAPVAFFGLTAVGGMPLIGVTDSKILLVFFYPLNACCNPYLYAILTKQYRRDLLLLLSRHGICTKRAAKYKTGAASTNNTMQTMQTVLRMGSMTETNTKVAGTGGGGRGSLLNGGRPSVAGNSPLENEGLLLISTTAAVVTGARKGQQNGGTSPEKDRKKEHAPKDLNLHNTNILSHSSEMMRSPSDDFRKAFHLQPPAAENDDDDVFDLNGLSGRHIAETTFISVPISPAGNGILNKKSDSGNNVVFRSGEPAKDKLIRHKVEQQHSTSSISEQENAVPVKLNDSTNFSSAVKASLKDEHELDHDITETTPFCSVRS